MWHGRHDSKMLCFTWKALHWKVFVAMYVCLYVLVSNCTFVSAVTNWDYHISPINTAFLISTSCSVVLFEYKKYWYSNNFISSASLNSTRCYFATLGITAYYWVTMIISSIVFKCNSKYRGNITGSILNM